MSDARSAAATGTFKAEDWEGQTYDDRDGWALGRATLTKHYVGDLEGIGTTALITVQGPEGPVAYVAIERFRGSLRGDVGSVVLLHSVDVPPATARLLPTTGTGAFEGRTGLVTIEIDEPGVHHYSLDLGPSGAGGETG